MATHWGNEGQVKVGVNTIAELTDWDFEGDVQPVDNTSMGKTAKTHIPNSGIPGWTGSMTCHWDESNVTGQGALVLGASVTLNLYPEGSTSGDVYFTCLATITNVGMKVPMDGATISRTYKWLANGAVTEATVA